MNSIKTLRVFLAALLLLIPASVGAKDLVKVPTCWMPEHETFIPWLAKQKGWDKEEGLDLELKFFDSGMAQMEALPAKEWVLGATGGVPALVGALRYNTYVIGLGNNESLTNAVYVRPDSPILKTKGFNPEYPDIFGSPESVKGKTILVTTVSSAHYALAVWLNALGVKDSEVVIKQMDQASIIAAFEKGVGDIACLWAPFTYAADTKGWKLVSDVEKGKALLPIVLIGASDFCDKNPETVAKFLRVFLRGVNYLKANGSSPEVVALYQTFMKDWGGIEMSDADAKKDIDMHPVWNLEEQLALLDSSKGQSAIDASQRKIAEFFTAQGRFKPAEMEQVNKSGYITDKFLKQVKTPIPTDK